MPDMSEIWKGYERLNFTFNNRSSILVKPKTPLKGNPWIWRAEFFDAFPSADMAMLEKGYYLVYHCVSNMYGCPSSVELMHEFYLYMKDKYKLSPKTVIFGFSRGGLYAVNFAVKYPSCVDILYLDAPVMDIKSWPGGKGSGKCSLHEWEECLNCHDLCKCNYYIKEERNRKVNGKWEQYETWTNNRNPSILLPHSSRSIRILRGFISLKFIEELIIFYHMGPFGGEDYEYRNLMQTANEKYPATLLFYTADLISSYLDEKCVDSE
jgi:pimeloyl-ACP methyl ester carboxylesterase